MDLARDGTLYNQPARALVAHNFCLLSSLSHSASGLFHQIQTSPQYIIIDDPDKSSPLSGVVYSFLSKALSPEIFARTLSKSLPEYGGKVRELWRGN